MPKPVADERPSLLMRLKSLHHAYWLWLSSAIKWRRGNYRERPAGSLDGFKPHQRARIEVLKAEYGIAFEQQFDHANTAENYTYLDVLDQFRRHCGQMWPAGRETLDLGSKNFYYAPVLHAAFRPTTLTGLEVEGYRVYPNFYSRYDYAQAFIRGLLNTRFVVGDVRSYQEPAGLVTCLYPFVFADVHVAWYLPLHLFDPTAYFANLARLLRADSHLIMVNQGQEEYAAASALCEHSGLNLCVHMEIAQPLTARRLPPQVSMWQRSDKQQQGGTT